MKQIPIIHVGKKETAEELGGGEIRSTFTCHLNLSML